jgi:polyhydroxyalkanoate synthase
MNRQATPKIKIKAAAKSSAKAVSKTAVKKVPAKKAVAKKVAAKAVTVKPAAKVAAKVAPKRSTTAATAAAMQKTVKKAATSAATSAVKTGVQAVKAVKKTSKVIGGAAKQAGTAAKRAGAMAKNAGSATGKGLTGVAFTASDLISEAAHNTLTASPLVGLRPADLGQAATDLLKALLTSPGSSKQHLGQYMKQLGSVVKGDSELMPDPKDRRFVDPAWKSNPVYKRLMQTYLATGKEMTDYIDHSSLDKRGKGRAQFLASLVVDALAPSNWILSNPTSVKKMVDTGGGSLVEGLKNLVHDVRHNNLMPSQVDATPFKVGVNLAASKGQVVYRSEIFELLQFNPTTPDVHARPLLMSPPQINKYYAVDLTPDKSLIKWATDSGIQFFCLSWRNPTKEHRDWGLDEYAMALDEAVDVVREITGSPDVNMWGSCSGGMTLAAYLGWLAAGPQKDRHKVANTSWAVCVLDMKSAMDDSTLGLFQSPTAIRAAKKRIKRNGITSGSELASMFAWLRPNDLIWNYWVNNYLLGNKPPVFDILAWNADTTRLPAQLHCDYLDLAEINPYVNPNAMEVAGRPIDMTKVDVGAYVVGGITDHITPWPGCYATARIFGKDSVFALSNAGHLQSMVNPPGNPKSYFLTAKASVDDPQKWPETAMRIEGSWWPHWTLWITERSGKKIPAPTKLGSRKYPPLCAAPGEYVMEP